MSNQTAENKRGGPKAPPALDPRNPLLVQPFKRLVEEGLLLSLRVDFTPSGFLADGEPSEKMISVEGSGLVKGARYPLGVLAAVADKGNLIPLKGKKSKTASSGVQPLPTKTLTKEDFAKAPAELLGRARVVAAACGGATLVGRVRSSGAFDGESTISFENWWSTANPMQRARALVLPKRIESLTRDEIGKLGGMQCPFRGDATFTVHEDAEEEAEATEKAAPRPASPPKKASGAE